jgi:transposase InsO family protein
MEVLRQHLEERPTIRRQLRTPSTSNEDELELHSQARDLTLSNINQLWVADITYIRLLREFIYLAVLLDAFSRRCIGWADHGFRLTQCLAVWFRANG